MKKSILYVVNHLRPGAIPNILYEIIPYISEEYDISLLCLQNNASKEVINKMKKQHVKVYSLNSNKYNIFQTIIRLYHFLDKFNPYIIHSHLGRSDIFCSFVKPKSSRHVTTFHSVKNNYNFFTRLLYKITDKKVETRTAVSKTVKNSWYDNNFLKSHCSVIYNPISIKEPLKKVRKEQLRKELNLDASKKIFINIGNLKKQKGQIYLIKAFKTVSDLYPNTILLLIGRKSDSYKEIKKQIKSLGLTDKVFLLGFRSDARDILSISHYFVFPSETEGLGIAVLEAMSAKIPVIASNIPAISEYLTDKVEGLLITYNDIDSISSEMIRLLGDEFLSDKLVKNALFKVVDNFDSELISSKYMEIYSNNDNYCNIYSKGADHDNLQNYIK